MLIYCPLCSNALALTQRGGGGDIQNVMECRTCTYSYAIRKRYTDAKSLRAKEVDDVLGGAEAWANADATGVQCPLEECNGDRAFYFQKQIRSADEPMTTFYRCTVCTHQWREN